MVTLIYSLFGKLINGIQSEQCTVLGFNLSAQSLSGEHPTSGVANGGRGGTTAIRQVRPGVSD